MASRWIPENVFQFDLGLLEGNSVLPSSNPSGVTSPPVDPGESTSSLVPTTAAPFNLDLLNPSSPIMNPGEHLVEETAVQDEFLNGNEDGALKALYEDLNAHPLLSFQADGGDSMGNLGHGLGGIQPFTGNFDAATNSLPSDPLAKVEDVNPIHPDGHETARDETKMVPETVHRPVLAVVPPGCGADGEFLRQSKSVSYPKASKEL